MSSVVPCVCWVPKGASKESPDKVQLSSEEVQTLLKGAEDQMKQLGFGEEPSEVDDGANSSDSKAEAEVAGGGDMKDIDDLYDMENYDSDDSPEGEKVTGAGMGVNVAGLAYHASNEDDPYITLKDTTPERDEDEDFKVLPTDNLLAIGKAEEDYSSVEVHVYSESDNHNYCHHEILLSAFPLALEWLDFDPEQPDKKGNYLAIGTMTPVIEVWDLDIIDGLEPVFTLGRSSLQMPGLSRSSKLSKKKGANKDNSICDGHRDSVLGLAWNKAVRNILASASADSTVRVWDLAWPKCVLTISHPDKVQCVCWHPYEPQLLVTGGFDNTIRLYDCKSSESVLKEWKLDGEIEKTLWNHFEPEQLLVSTQSKMVWGLHKGSGSTLFKISAHNDVITDITLSCNVPGLLVTAGADDTVKFWDILDNKPVFLLSKDVHMGSVLCAKFCSDSPYSLAVGGEKNGFHIINVANLPQVMQRFKDRKLMAPVTPPSQVFSSLAPKPPADDVTIDKSEDSMDVGDQASASGTASVTKHPSKKVIHSKKKKARKHKH